MKVMTDHLRIFDRVDWDFKDFSSRVFKLDINNLHWYPASFIPPIPDILIQVLTKEGDLVLDPFAGSGVTLVEAARLGRKFVGVDINPFAVDISKAKFQAILHATPYWKNTLQKDVLPTKINESVDKYCENHGISAEVFKWFEEKTLTELIWVHNVILDNHRDQFLLEKVLFSSILSRSCSQKRHYTYITDGCYPRKFEYKPAVNFFLEQAQLVSQASGIFREKFKRRLSKEYVFDGEIKLADARNLGWIDNSSVDLVVTSPPYLGTHDYVKSMRITNLFFPQPDYKKFLADEIGARYKRQRKTAYEEYVKDMKRAFEECHRVLSPKGFFGLTLGQGKGRVVKSDVVKQLVNFLRFELNFNKIFETSRNISSRRIRFPGVLKEHIIVLQKTE